MEIVSVYKSDNTKPVDVAKKIGLIDNATTEIEKKWTRSLWNRKLDVEDEISATMKIVLQKLPFKRNKAVPCVPDLLSNGFGWNWHVFGDWKILG